ncbi:MAG: Lrp/AsnC family transcriptional regulator [Candidatus Micrarchaeaceae archaeon]|nr:Lrp/AsnC family transcriptional regulator [Candidatus Parvarchaeota archaeon]
MIRMKALDIAILKELKNNLSIGDAAKKLGLRNSTMYYHFNRLKKAGLISGYRTAFKASDVDNEHVFVLLSLVSLKKDSTGELFNMLKKNSDIVSEVYSIGGGWDYMLSLSGQKDRITDFITKELHSLKNIKRTYSMFVIKENEI